MAFDGVPPEVDRGRLLPDLRDRRRTRALPVEYIRRPNVPPESPTLGLTHLPLVAMLGLLGLRIFEATGSNIEDLGDEHGHRVLRVRRQVRQGRSRPALADAPTHAQAHLRR